MSKRRWLVVGVDGRLWKRLQPLAEENNASLQIMGQECPDMAPSKVKFADVVFVQPKDESNECSLYLMSWCSQVAWWNDRQRLSSIIMLLPQKDVSKFQVYRCSMEPLKYAQVLEV